MAELPNSPPSAADPRASARVKPSGPVFHENVAKVRVSSGGVVPTTEFNGKTVGRGGEPVAVSSLGWDHDDLAAAEADPKIVIERFDKNGKLVKKDGTPYPAAGELTPKAKMTKDE